MSASLPDDTARAASHQCLPKWKGMSRGALCFPIITILFVLLTIGAGIFLIFEKQNRTETEIIQQNLAAVSNLKAGQIHEWLAKSKVNVTNRANHPLITVHAAKWMRKGARNDDKSTWLRQQMGEMSGQYNIKAMALLDLSGKPLISTSPEMMSAPPGVELIRSAVNERKTMAGIMRWNRLPDGTRNATLDIVSPMILKKTNKITGVLWAEYDAETSLFPMIDSWPIQNRTAESMLFVRQGDEALLLNRLRFQPDTQRLSLAQANLLHTKAARMGMSMIEGPDYRGETVIGFSARIPDTDWVMISKIDKDEVFAPVRRRAIVDFVSVALLLTILCASIYFWWRNRDAKFREAQLQHELKERFLSQQNEYLSKYANDIILLLNETGMVIDANDRAESAYRQPRSALIGKNIVDIRSPAEKEISDTHLKKIAQNGDMVFETGHVRADGTEFPVEISARTIPNGGTIYIQCIIRDITERKEAQERERCLTDMYRAISATNEAIIRVQSRFELFPLVCRIAVEHGGMVLAWVGIPDESGWFAPVASSSRSERHLSDLSELTRPGATEGTSVLSRAFLENRPAVANDFGRDDATATWRERNGKYGVQSIAAFPISRSGKPHAVLAVYSDHIDAFGHEIVNLLQGMAANISFSLDNFDREAAQKSASDSLKLAAMVYQDSSEAMVVTDVGNRIVAVNPAFEHITGYQADDVIGRQPEFLKSDREDDATYNAIRESIEATGRWKGELWSITRTGQDFAVMLSVNTTFSSDGSVQRRVALFSDITSKKESDEMIWNQANFDSLTSLPNRRLFRDHLRQEIKKSRRAGQRLALMFLDLDGFKDINDTLGHDMGDLLLKGAAERLNASVREVDTVARLGGDEFTVILSELHDPGNVDRIARGILRKLSEPFMLREEVAHITASIGITFYPDDATELEDLLKNADQAMYASKQSGKNQYQFFTAAMQEAAMARMRLINDLRVALEENQFELVYQPIVDLASDRILKAEALIRWNHPTRGIISPIEFIPLAEDTGLINSFGDWVFHEAARQAASWQENYHPQFQISVNISPVQFRNDGIDSTVWFRHLETLGLQTRGIVVEITEGLLLDADPSVTAQLLALRDAGIEVALDDFGVGYSSLSYLQKFDIDYIKIDQSFVKNLGEGSGDLALCEAIIVMAHKLGLKVIAEGVETELQRGLLSEAGCDFLQGYLISSPLPARDMEDLLEASLAAHAV